MAVSVESQGKSAPGICTPGTEHQAQVSRRVSLLIWLAASLAGWAIAISASYGLYAALS